MTDAEAELRKALTDALAVLEIALEPWVGAAKANGVRFIRQKREEFGLAAVTETKVEQ